MTCPLLSFKGFAKGQMILWKAGLHVYLMNPSSLFHYEAHQSSFTNQQSKTETYLISPALHFL